MTRPRTRNRLHATHTRPGHHKIKRREELRGNSTDQLPFYQIRVLTREQYEIRSCENGGKNFFNRSFQGQRVLEPRNAAGM